MNNASAVLPPLFPLPIPIIGATGEYASGKTVFGMSICPQSTLVYDMEKSCETYQGFDAKRLDVPLELQRRYPNGYKPLQTYEWWRDHARSLRPGAHRVVMVDPASEIEAGLTEWVRANPGYFGHTSAQYQKMSGIMWGDVKELWKALLADLASRCEVFYFTVHMGDVWQGDKPVPGKRKPRGKSTLMELASLFLHLERRPDAKGTIAKKPSAIVLKSRLMRIGRAPDGSIDVDNMTPYLPPRLPVATPTAIRAYLLAPPDYAQLRPEELAPESVLSDDDRAALRLSIAEAERDREQAHLERTQREQDSARRRQEAETKRQGQSLPPAPAVLASPPMQAAPSDAVPQLNKGKDTPATPATSPAGEPKPARPQTASFSAHAIREEQLLVLAELRQALFDGPMAAVDADARKEAWQAILAKRRVNTARALTQEQAAELIDKLRARVAVAPLAEAAPPPSGAEEGESAATAACGG